MTISSAQGQVDGIFSPRLRWPRTRTAGSRRTKTRCPAAADLDAWVRLRALHDIDGLAQVEPDTMRLRRYHLPARLATHARRRWLRIELAAAHRPSDRRLTPDPRSDDQKGARSRARGTRRPHSVTRRPASMTSKTFRANRRGITERKQLTDRGQAGSK